MVQGRTKGLEMPPNPSMEQEKGSSKSLEWCWKEKGAARVRVGNLGLKSFGFWDGICLWWRLVRAWNGIPRKAVDGAALIKAIFP